MRLHVLERFLRVLEPPEEVCTRILSFVRVQPFTKFGESFVQPLLLKVLRKTYLTRRSIVMRSPFTKFSFVAGSFSTSVRVSSSKRNFKVVRRPISSG